MVTAWPSSTSHMVVARTRLRGCRGEVSSATIRRCIRVGSCVSGHLSATKRADAHCTPVPLPTPCHWGQICGTSGILVGCRRRICAMDDRLQATLGVPLAGSVMACDNGGSPAGSGCGVSWHRSSAGPTMWLCGEPPWWRMWRVLLTSGRMHPKKSSSWLLQPPW
jgi:hypothetical protein